jgi:arylsulfatase A-like enzyme
MLLAKQVILFVIDGLRPDALQQAHTSEIDKLVAQGAYTWRAQTVTPSVSLPCHTSLFFAVPPARHGVVSNVWTPLPPPVPSLIEVVHQAGLGTAAFYTWEELRDLARPGALDFAYYHRLGDPEGGSHQITSAVNIIDTAPTIAYLLGLPTPTEWSGRVVTEVSAS